MKFYYYLFVGKEFKPMHSYSPPLTISIIIALMTAVDPYVAKKYYRHVYIFNGIINYEKIISIIKYKWKMCFFLYIDKVTCSYIFL